MHLMQQIINEVQVQCWGDNVTLMQTKVTCEAVSDVAFVGHHEAGTLIQVVKHTEHIPTHTLIPRFLEEPIKPHCRKRLLGVNKQHKIILSFSFPPTQHLT
jgi:hypothetical protein